MEFGISGKTALITGGSQGVGRAAAYLFAAEGCNVVLVARTADDLECVRQDITAKYPVSVSTVAINVAEPDAAEKLAEQFPNIDILVNNAGAIPAGSITDVDDKTWRMGWELKVFGYIALTRSYYGRMRDRRSGVIVNVMGASGNRPGPRTIAVGTANAALNALTRAIGGSSPADGVRVVGVNPGPIATERGIRMRRQRAEALWGDPERWQELSRDAPFGRPAEPEEVASAVVFLASRPAGYISGAVLDVDGGTASKVDNY